MRAKDEEIDEKEFNDPYNEGIEEVEYKEDVKNK